MASSRRRATVISDHRFRLRRPVAECYRLTDANVASCILEIPTMPAPSSSALGFAQANARWLGAGTLLTMSSAFGQTFFIALFNDDIRAAFSLSNGQFGTVYAIATLASAATLISLGRVADRADIARVVGLCIAALGVVALVMAALPSLAWMGWPAIGLLTLGIYGLRLFGQGMMTHLSMTLMAKWFARNRGRAIAVAALGLPLAEASFPRLAVFIENQLGWRFVWALGGLALIAIIAPFVGWLVSRMRSPAAMAEESGGVDFGLTRAEVLRRPSFYLLVFGLMSFGFSYTGVFFTQTNLVAEKGWPIDLYASAFALYAGLSVSFMLVGGWAVDRFGAISLLPFNLLPAAIGLLVLATFDAPATAFVFLALGGITMGFNAATVGALWAEIYGTRHLGSIRSVISSSMVFATALAPVILGWLLDAGVPIERQIAGLGVFMLTGQMVLAIVSRRQTVLRPEDCYSPPLEAAAERS